MSTARKTARPRFRVGDWVTVLYGPQLVLARVIEDRGPLGVRGRRIYRIRIDFVEGEPTIFELGEDELEPASAADIEAWKAKGSIALHQTMTYFGDARDEYGRPKPFFHYLVVAKPGAKPESGAASIMSLSEATAIGVAQGPSASVETQEGGPEGALVKAEEYLDAKHRGLHKTVGNLRP